MRWRPSWTRGASPERRFATSSSGKDCPEDNTWERLSKLGGCKKLLRAFEAKLSKKKQSQEKHGFGRGLTPEKVIGATKISGELTLQVKWKESDRADLVPAKEANEKIPQLVIQFYEDNINKGCSTGYNYNEYKEHIQADFNSQAREQMHAILQKMAPSLWMMNYKSFMIVMRVFFMIRNLKIKGAI